MKQKTFKNVPTARIQKMSKHYTYKQIASFLTSEGYRNQFGNAVTWMNIAQRIKIANKKASQETQPQVANKAVSIPQEVSTHHSDFNFAEVHEIAISNLSSKLKRKFIYELVK